MEQFEVIFLKCKFLVTCNKYIAFYSQQTGIIQRDLYPLTPSNKPSMKAREWIDQGLNRNPDLMDLLNDFPLQDGETETRDMRTREQREVASARQMASRYMYMYTVQIIFFFLHNIRNRAASF